MVLILANISESEKFAKFSTREKKNPPIFLFLESWCSKIAKISTLNLNWKQKSLKLVYANNSSLKVVDLLTVS